MAAALLPVASLTSSSIGTLSLSISFCYHFLASPWRQRPDIPCGGISDSAEIGDGESQGKDPHDAHKELRYDNDDEDSREMTSRLRDLLGQMGRAI